MKYYPKVMGERVYLSPISMEDVEQYTRWMNDPEISDNMGMSHVVYHLDKERKALEELMWGHNFSIIEKAGHRLLGGIGFSEVKQIYRSAMCGLFIGEEEDRSKGFGGEALSLLPRYGFGVMNLHSVSLQVFDYNDRAISCYKKVGFQETGRRRSAYFANGHYHDVILMDLLEDEYKSRN